MLRLDSTYRSKTNLGYAYLWLAGIRNEQGKSTDAQAFLLLARETWEEYAPGLLSETKALDTLIITEHLTISISQTHKIEEEFLNNNKKLIG